MKIKPIIAFCAALALMGGFFSIPSRSLGEEAVWFPNEKVMEAVIKYARYQDLDEKHLTQIRGDLDLSNMGIEDISFMTQFKQIESLDISGNPISDFSPLAGLPKLEKLLIYDPTLTDLSSLSAVTGLKHLVAGGTPLADLHFLTHLTGLETLELSDTPLFDLTAFKALPRLNYLALSNTGIDDISVLYGMTELTTLYIDSNRIADLSALASLSGLKALYVQNNRVADISALSGLDALRTLNAADNLIKAIPDEWSLSALTDLNLANNLIRSIGREVKLPSASHVFLEHNRLRSITNLCAGAERIIHLNISGNPIADFTGIASLPQLEHLDMAFTGAQDLSFLEGMDGLVSLDASWNRITSLTPLSGLIYLQKLFLSWNRIDDISALAGLERMRSLDLCANQISDVSAIEKMARLMTIDLSLNRITDLSALRGKPELREVSALHNQIQTMDVGGLSAQSPDCWKLLLNGNPALHGASPGANPPRLTVLDDRLFINMDGSEAGKLSIDLTPDAVQSANKTPYVFKSNALEKAVRRAVGKAEGPIAYAELKDLGSLVITDEEPDELLRLLEHTPNLKMLYINQISIWDDDGKDYLKPIGQMAELEALFLCGVDVAGNISPLQGCPSLRALDLCFASFKAIDLNALIGLENLEMIHFWSDTWADSYRPLLDLQSLRWLGADFHRVNNTLGLNELARRITVINTSADEAFCTDCPD